MAYRLAPGVHAALVGEHAVVLNVVTDRYTRLDRSLSNALGRCLDGADIPPDQVARLLELKLIEPATCAAPGAAILPPVADRSIDDEGAQRGAIRPIATALHMAAARRALRQQGLASTLAHAARRSHSCADRDDERAAAIAWSFRIARDWLPFARACLPDSLALHAILSSRRVATTLVIGVKDHPFSAHCWVQSGSLVLTDPLHEIEPLVPILAI